MRVRGSISPDAVIVEDSARLSGFSEVRVRENIHEVTEKDSLTGDSVTLYEYDEYIFNVPTQKGLKKKITASLSDWLVTGKNSEVATNATLYVTAKADAIDQYTEQLIAEGVI